MPNNIGGQRPVYTAPPDTTNERSDEGRTEETIPRVGEQGGERTSQFSVAELRRVTGQVATEIHGLIRVVTNLYGLYMECEELNNIQPNSFAEAIPMSLDDWISTLYECVEDWNRIANGTTPLEVQTK